MSVAMVPTQCSCHRLVDGGIVKQYTTDFRALTRRNDRVKIVSVKSKP